MVNYLNCLVFVLALKNAACYSKHVVGLHLFNFLYTSEF